MSVSAETDLTGWLGKCWRSPSLRFLTLPYLALFLLSHPPPPVEGRKQVYAEDFPLNEAWLDRVISQKLALRESLNLDGDSDFLKTRLPVKGEQQAATTASDEEAQKQEETTSA